MTDDEIGNVRGWKWWLKLAIRITVFAAVVWYLWQAVDDAYAQMLAKDELKGFMETAQGRWRLVKSIHLPWLFAAMGVYLVGLLCYCVFWHRTLQTMDQRPRFLETVRAYYIGHLGKYVPGKALVVGLRIDFIRSPRVDGTIAGTSVFVETLTMMAVGAAIAALTFVVLGVGEIWFIPVAVLVGLGTGVPTWPSLFRRIVKRVGVKRMNPDVDRAVEKLDLRLMAFGWAANAVGWVLLGLSLWACVCALPDVLLVETPAANPWTQLPIVTAAVAFAMVGGFLSLLPGGVGIREVVIVALLTEPYGAAAATVSAVFLRLIMLVSEVAISIILLVVGWFMPAD